MLRPVTRRTTSPVSAPITYAWYPNAAPGRQYGRWPASRAAISRSSASSSRLNPVSAPGTPARCESSSRSVMSCLPAAANSGQ
jgi:hypothetical protein